jgi:hypothetical protein
LAGLFAGERLVRIDDLAVRHMNLDDVIAHLRGGAGTTGTADRLTRWQGENRRCYSGLYSGCGICFCPSRLENPLGWRQRELGWVCQAGTLRAGCRARRHRCIDGVHEGGGSGRDLGPSRQFRWAL